MNDYALTMDHVNTLARKNQNEDRPLLVAESSAYTTKIGTAQRASQ